MRAVTLPSTASKAAAPGSRHTLAHVTLSTMMGDPAGVMAAAPLPSSRSLGGVLSTGGAKVGAGAGGAAAAALASPVLPPSATSAPSSLLHCPLTEHRAISGHQRSDAAHLRAARAARLGVSHPLMRQTPARRLGHAAKQCSARRAALHRTAA